MKKIITICIAAFLVLTLGACKSRGNTDDKTIKIGATPRPHAEILNVVKDLLAKEGYTLEIVEFNDYVLPNTAVESGELDANFFQHVPYMEDFNANNGTHIVSVGGVHYEPMGLFGGKSKSLDSIPDGALVLVPNDTTNEARALLLLQDNGLIKLKDGVGLTATVLDIVENPHNLNVKEVEAAQAARSLNDADFAVLNGNYALQVGLTLNDALKAESADSVAAKTYTNVLSVKDGNQNSAKIQALYKALTSKEVKEFIEKTYSGEVVPSF
ncbi:MAG: MetQ/NlpA family ABC transporter substrate-binding protein [Erysipelotrichales bacterium]|nr:MetQ/NlpA family ABC transporter substrate-binding protein [Erysipelotrichales bacterium]MBQ4375414.1 MetQ/NlpA family ABC transporter substrate-binding protein [Erysipelotrichales bacterium]MBQ5542409.1 MetQ/NlpA family ABC transporter substrate-binding protein [Erysipelotrichales bacterium]